MYARKGKLGVGVGREFSPHRCDEVVNQIYTWSNSHKVVTREIIHLEELSHATVD